MNAEADLSCLEGRILAVKNRVELACAQAGRAVDDVVLVAVSKTRTPEEVCAAARAGLHIFGENKVQEAAWKIPECPSHVEWHLVGHLQSNKVKHAVLLFEWIHSVDSRELLLRLDRVAGEEGRRPRVFLQVNVSGERSKSGMAPEQLPAVLDASAGCTHVEVCGLMSIPPVVPDPAQARPFFAVLRRLRDDAMARGGWALPFLSMGMSYDLEAAILEGATHVRVGTDIFGPRAPREAE